MTIEHTDVEVDEGEEPTAPQPHTHGPPTPSDVVKAALAQRLPCTVCGAVEPCQHPPPIEAARVDDRVTLIVQALILYGYLPDPDEAGDTFDPVETAQWLADRSGFARYTQVKDGWKRLLEAEADVDLAAIKAMKRVPADEADMVKAARAALLAHHQSGVGSGSAT